MPNDLDKQVRTAIGEIISATAPDAKVYPWNVLDHDVDDWPGLFRTAGDGLHGWVIRRREVASSWKNLGRRDHRFPEYDVFGFYKFRSGKLGDNSDDEFAEICDDVYEAFKAKPDLDLSGVVEKHDLLQFAVITTTRPGEETMHFAHGRLKVYLCC